MRLAPGSKLLCNAFLVSIQYFAGIAAPGQRSLFEPPYLIAQPSQQIRLMRNNEHRAAMAAQTVDHDQPFLALQGVELGQSLIQRQQVDPGSREQTARSQ